MSNVTLGTIASHPNENGEHTLKCPSCSQVFLSTITKDDETGDLINSTCPACGHNDEPKLFVATAHQSEVNNLAMGYATKELTKIFKKIR